MSRRAAKLPKEAVLPGQVEMGVGQLKPINDFVVLEELFPPSISVVAQGVVRVSLAGHVTRGKIIAVSPTVSQLEGLKSGDIVRYEEFQGGRWEFNDVKVLIIGVKHILAIEREVKDE